MYGVAGVANQSDQQIMRFCACVLLSLSLNYATAQSLDVRVSQAVNQASDPIIQAADSLKQQPVDGERLSNWMIRQGFADQHYFTGLIWGVPSEDSRQEALRQSLLAELDRISSLPSGFRSRFKGLLVRLPITGRITLPRSDARWLQAHPQSDPIIYRGHRLLLADRPNSVLIINDDGTFCEIVHAAGRRIVDYLTSCGTDLNSQFERAWLIQPDGFVADYGVKAWNLENQDEPAPGAIVWAPGRNWSNDFSQKFAQFLATQSFRELVSPNRIQDLSHKRIFSVPKASIARSFPTTSNDFGLVGLLQTPSARMGRPGETRFHYSRIAPYERFNIFVQPHDAFEVGFRYTNILNRAYGPVELSGSQTYKDKSLDFKLRLYQESARLPEVALGVSDLGGTGQFSSEYIVLGKRWNQFDFSLGLGWGYLASSGSIGNPLGLLDSRFKTRDVTTSPLGGTPNTNSYFRGRAAMFGGVQYHSPWNSLIFKAEYDGNDYRSEPLENKISQRSPINFGVVYRYHPQLDLTLGFERGTTFMVGLSLHTQLASMHTPKVSDPPKLSVNSRPPGEKVDWQATAGDVQGMSNWGVRSIQAEPGILRVFVDSAMGAHWHERIDRITAVLNRDASPSIQTFEIVVLEQGVPITKRVVDRPSWIRSNSEFVPPSQAVSVITAMEPSQVARPAVDTLWDRPRNIFGYSFVPILQQNFGGPDSFLLFSVGASVPARINLTENTAISGALNLKFVDNFDNFKYTAPSELPRVRTYLREYMTSSALTLPYLQIHHFGELARNHYYSVYAGYLEYMYGGVGGEWLYRPWHSPISLGIDLNHVQQRDFKQSFGFANAGSQSGYRVTTGHASAYWDTGWQSTMVKVSAGRYLAGDVGLTLDLSKTFGNGVVMGAWATKTDVSAQKFGEGSFDKGLYLRIPFDVMTTTRTGNVANLVYNPLTRDGGARLNRVFTLFDATAGRSERETSFVPAEMIRR